MDANLKQGVQIEKEHRDLYIELKKRLADQGIKMPMTETEFFTWIAQAHISENKDYYPQLLKYVEKEHSKKETGGAVTPSKFSYLDILTDNPARHEHNASVFDGKRHFYLVTKVLGPDTTMVAPYNTENRYWVDSMISELGGESTGSFKVYEPNIELYTPTRDELQKLIKRYERYQDNAIQKSDAQEYKQILKGLEEKYAHILNNTSNHSTLNTQQSTPMIYQTKFNELKEYIATAPGFTVNPRATELPESLDAWSASYNYNGCHIIVHFGNGTNKLPDNEIKINITKNYGSNGLGAHREFTFDLSNPIFFDQAAVSNIMEKCKEINTEVAEKVDARLATEIALLNQAKAEVKGDKPTKRERVNISSVLNMLNSTMSYKPEFYPEFAKLVLESGVKYTINPYNEYDGNTEVADWLKSINKNVLDFLPVKEYSLPKYKPFDTTPDDKTFMAIHGGFAGDEDIRPNLLGSNFGQHGVVTTDAMQLLFTKYNTTGAKQGNYCHTKKCFDNVEAVEEAKYPNWAAIVPMGSSIKWHLNAHALINALKNIIALDLLPNFAKYICLTGLTAIDNTIVFDAKALLSCIEAMVKLGHTDLEMGWSAPNRAALIYPKGNANKIQPGSTNASFETDFALIMPRILNDGSAGDPYFNVDTNCVTFDKTDAPYCFDAIVTEAKKVQAREQALATELENSKAQIAELKKQNEARNAELAAQKAEEELKRKALADAADAKRKQELDNKRLGNIEALARKIKTKKQAKEAISKARTFTAQQINDTIAGNLIVLETMPDGPAKQALHDYTEGLRVMVDTDNVYAGGGGVFRPSGLGLSYDAQTAYMYDKITKAELEEFKKLERTAPSVFIGYQNMTKKQAKDWDRLEELKEKIKESYEFAQGGGVKGKLKPGVYKVGKPIKLSPILYEQKMAEVNDDGSVSEASNYARKLVILNTEHKNYPLISQEDITAHKTGTYTEPRKVGQTVYDRFGNPYIVKQIREDGVIFAKDKTGEFTKVAPFSPHELFTNNPKTFSKGGTVGKIKASAKDIQSIEHLVDFSVRGNSHQLPYDGEVERMLEDHRMFLNDKEFFDKYGDKIGSHPDADEFEEESGNMEEFRITDQYYITFKDGSEIQLDFTPDGDFQQIYSPDVDEHMPESQPKTMAVKHYDEFAKQGWDMDITALEEFVKTGKFEQGGGVDAAAEQYYAEGKYADGTDYFESFKSKNELITTIIGLDPDGFDLPTIKGYAEFSDGSTKQIYPQTHKYGGAPNERFIFGIEYKATPTSRVFKKASLTMNGADTAEMNEAITKNAESLKKQEGWHEVKITKTPLFKDGGSVDGFDVDEITKHYLIAALWSSTDDEGNPLDSEYGTYDFAPETTEKVKHLVSKFVIQNSADLTESGLTNEQIGHDLWLTQVGHGTGFWDRDLDKELGNRLSTEAKKLGQSANPYAEDGVVYIDGLADVKKFKTGGPVNKIPAGVKSAAQYIVKQAKEKGIDEITISSFKEIANSEIPNKKDALIQLSTVKYNSKIVISYDDINKLRTWLEKLPDEFSIKNQYENQAESSIWEAWDLKQRKHFLQDHHEDLARYAEGYERTSGENVYTTSDSYVNNRYHQLPEYVKLCLLEHIQSGQYATGGPIDKGGQKLRKGDKVKTREGKIETVSGFTKDGTGVWTQENEYSWPPYTLELIPTLKGPIEPGTFVYATTGVKQKVLEYSPKFGGRILVERADGHPGGKPMWRPIKQYSLTNTMEK